MNSHSIMWQNTIGTSRFQLGKLQLISFFFECSLNTVLVCGCHSRFPHSLCKNQLCCLLVKTTSEQLAWVACLLRLRLSCQPVACEGLLHTLWAFRIIEHRKSVVLEKGIMWLRGTRIIGSKQHGYFVILSAIICYSWLIRFSFLPSLTLVCLLTVDFSDISSGDWTVHEHVEPQPRAPWHVRARDEVFLRLKGLQQGRRQQQGHQASCEEEVVLSKSA